MVCDDVIGIFNQKVNNFMMQGAVLECKLSGY
jgi:hypothetical protein